MDRRIDLQANLNRVEVGFSLTINLGNYNSTKVSAVSDCCVCGLDEIPGAFDQLYSILRQKVGEAVVKLVSGIKNSGGIKDG